MKLKREDIIQIVVGSLSLGLFLWGFVHEYNNAPEEDRSTYLFVLMTAVSLYVLILSDRITAYLTNKRALQDFKSIIPDDLQVFKKFDDSKAAFAYIQNRIKTASLVKNTMIQKRGEEIEQNYRTEFDKTFLKALKKNANLECIEVVSKGFECKALERKKDAINSYNAYLIEDIPTAFLNFIIIRIDADERELVIGWATNVTNQNQDAFLIKDDRLIKYFEHIFDSMQNNGTRIQ